MDDEQLTQVLGALNRRMTAAAPIDPERKAECLTFFRARALALDPARESGTEQAHRSGCRRCRQLVASFARHLPHLPTRTLIRLQLGTLRPVEAQAVEYHLHAGRCRECVVRAARLAHSPLALLQFPTPASWPTTAIARAAVPEAEVLAQGENGDLQADLVREGGKLCLEVRTRNPDYLRQLVTYVFETASGAPLLEGYLVLGPDVEGWITALVMIDPERFRAEATGGRGSLQIAVVRPGFLSAEEWAHVEAAAPGAEAPAEVRADWLQFSRRSLAEPGSLSAAGVETLQAISNQLSASAGAREAGGHAQPE